MRSRFTQRGVTIIAVTALDASASQLVADRGGAAAFVAPAFAAPTPIRHAEAPGSGGFAFVVFVACVADAAILVTAVRVLGAGPIPATSS